MFMSTQQFAFKFSGAEFLDSTNASVVDLRFVVSPTHIFWKVSKLIIDAVQRKSKRTFTYISDKIYKVLPTFTYCNATTAIVFISFIIGVIATISHAAPNSIKRMTVFSCAGVTMAIAWNLASTGTFSIWFKMLNSDNVSISAIALTEPSPMFVAFWADSIDSFDCDQSSKALICDIASCSSTTAARLNVAVFEIGSYCGMEITAITLAQPSPTLVPFSTNLIDLLDRDQSAETLICDIDGFGHRTGSFGSESSGGIDASTLIPLRTLA